MSVVERPTLPGDVGSWRFRTSKKAGVREPKNTVPAVFVKHQDAVPEKRALERETRELACHRLRIMQTNAWEI
jgi:hypothetical protein